MTLEEIEKAVLGACMIEGSGFPMASKILSHECFSVTAHQLIFSAMEGLAGKGLPIDILTVTQALREAGTIDRAGKSSYVTSCTSRINQALNVEAHAYIVREQYIKREMFKAGNTLAAAAQDETVSASDGLGDVVTALMALMGRASRREPVQVGTAFDVFKQELFEAAQAPSGIVGIPTGIPALDRHLGGYRNKLIILAGRPGMGKSTLPIGGLIACARSGRTAMLFSLEMGKAEVAGRIISHMAGVPIHRMLNAVGPEAASLDASIAELHALPILIDDTPAIQFQELRAKVLRAHAERPVGLVVVDYIQLMGTKKQAGKSREQEVAELSASLKSLQMEVGVPVVALSQLSRSVESRGGDKRPMLSDLRESGSIEQDADIVLFLYRPDYYGITEDEAGNSIEGLCEIIVAKFRGGKAPHIVNAAARFECFRFEPWADSYYIE